MPESYATNHFIRRRESAVILQYILQPAICFVTGQIEAILARRND